MYHKRFMLVSLRAGALKPGGGLRGLQSALRCDLDGLAHRHLGIFPYVDSITNLCHCDITLLKRRRGENQEKMET
jgi:hypothetical protein